MMNKQTRFPAATALLLCTVLGACQAQEPRPDPATVQQQVQALKDKTLQQLVPIPAGGFWLGDVGVLMTEELKQSGAILGPELKETDNPGFTLGQDNKPPRWVTFDAFQMQAYKVSYGDFDVYVAANQLPAHPPKEKDEFWQRFWQKARLTDDTPAGVTWPQAKGYCQWLGHITGLPFDLPTEAQWEYAVSTGRKTHHEPYPTPDGLYKEGRDEPIYDERRKMTKYHDWPYPIGLGAPSKWGLYDTVFNGFEWVNDWYAEDAYQSMSNTHNPQGPATGTKKVKRGLAIGDGRTFTGFPHVDRYHDLPEKKTGKLPDFVKNKMEEERLPYDQETFRCVVNQPSEKASPNQAGASK